jgi:ABC-2 type transport system ATP-binding protein
VSREVASRWVAHPVIEVSGLRKSYGSTPAVKDVSFKVEEGEIFGILGPNGAGKTTTVECISGLRKPDSGTISVLGLDAQRDRALLRERVGVQLQEGTLRPQLTVAETVNLFASFYPQPADTEELIETLGLGPKRNTYYRRFSRAEAAALDRARAHRQPADRHTRRADDRA